MSRKMVQRAHAVTGMLLASAMLCATGMAVMVEPAPQASAVSVSEYQNKVANHAKLKAQLSGVSSDLADTILQLADLNDNQIPAAVEAAESAQQAAQQAQSLADATAERLEAAKQDKATLEEQIAQTGSDYDDAKAAVAQLARQSFHGSDVSDVLDVVTNSTTTDEFVNKMQSEAAVTRSETNAASDAANDLNTSMNREERLSAIEDKITQLKTQADEQAASAQQAASDANAKKEALQQLRDEGAAKREKLEAQKSQLTTQSAREAADIVSMKSQIDSWNDQYSSSSSAAVNPGNNQQQTGGNASSNNASTNTGGSQSNTNNTSNNTSSGGASGMDYSVPGNCPSGSGFCYGHSTGNTVGGSAYPARQCTLWAYLRRSQLGLPVGSYMGNGAEWANTARSLGYLVNNTPHYGAVMVFSRGQSVGGHWTADWQYGHVAVVERVNADGSVLISEGGTGFSTFPAWETISNAGAYQYIHY
jgi:peptidoglycan DL-endopeptidase CwlO